MENLEIRITPAVRTWTGAVDNIWTDPGNWDAAVSPGDDLVFPPNAVRFTSANDFPEGTPFNSIRIEAPDYSLIGHSLSLAGGVTASYATTGTSSDDIDTDLGGGSISVRITDTLNFGGAISGIAGLSVSGGGNLVLDHATVNSYSGGTVVVDGTLQLDKLGVVAIPGTLQIGNPPGGSALVQDLASNQIEPGANVIIDDTGVLDLNDSLEQIGALTLTGGTVTTSGGTLTLGGSVTVNPDPAGSLIEGNVDLGGALRGFAVAGSGTQLTIGANISGTGAGIMKTGTGGLMLLGNDTYDGATLINQGDLTIGSATALGSTAGSTTVSAGADLVLSGGIAVGNEAINLNGSGPAGGGALLSQNGWNSISGPVTLQSGTDIGVVGSGSQLTLSGVIGSAPVIGFTKDGNGTLVLTSTNTYTGPTTVNSGVLSISDPGALGSSTVGTTVASGAELDLSNNIALGAEPISLSGSGVVGVGALRSTSGTNSLAGMVILLANSTIGVDAGAFTVSGPAVDGGSGLSLTKVGAGLLTLSGASTYTGTTNLTGGRLNVDGSLAAGSTIGVASGTTLGGVGTVGAVNSIGGTIAPGDSPSPGILSTGNLSLDSASTFGAVIDGNTAGSGANNYSQLNVTGTLALGGATFSSTLGGSYAPAPGDSLIVIKNSGGSAVGNTFNGLSEGAYLNYGLAKTFQITYSGGSGRDVALNYVQDTNTSVTSDAHPSVFGQPVTLTATVTAAISGTPTGSVRFEEGSTVLGFAPLNGSGQASLAPMTFSLGSHNITATYTGDSADAPSTSSIFTQVVNQASTTTVVGSTTNPSVFGQSVTFTATVSAVAPGAGTPTGNVEFFDGATDLGGGALVAGSATLSISGLAVTTHSITAVYAGDSNFVGSTSSSLSQVVNPAATTTAVSKSAPAGTPVVGQMVTFTATVTATAPGAGLPTGAVEFFDGATDLGPGASLDATGNSTFSISTLAVGGHSITAVYAGDADFKSSTSPNLAQTISQAATSTSLSQDANPSVFGQSVTFTAHVVAQAPGGGVPGGAVEFFDGATDLGAGTALDASGDSTFSISSLNLGNHSITGVYAGSASYTGSASPVITQTVNQAATNSVVVKSAPATTPVFGQSVTFTGTVSAAAPGGGVPTGAVEFFDGATDLGPGTALDASGQSSFSTSTLSVGAHNISAVYAGDSNFLASTAPALAQSVSQASTATVLVSSMNPSVFGQAVKFTATVAATAPGAGIPTGSVEFFDGATDLGGSPLSGGSAAFSLSSLGVATHSITAVYQGDTNFVTSGSAPLSQVVSAASTSTAVNSSLNPAIFGQAVTFTATVTTNPPGSGIPTGSVSFLDGATSLGTTTLNASGQAILQTTSLSVGSHTITAQFLGSTNFNSTTSPGLTQTISQAATTTTVTPDANPSVIGQSVTFTANVVAVPPGGGVPTGAVEFFDGVTDLGPGTALDGFGNSTFTTSSLSLGNHSMTAVYSGDANNTGSTSLVVTQTVNQAATATVVFKSAPAGTPLFGQMVTFTATVSAATPGAGLPTGGAEFFDGTTDLGPGTALDALGNSTFSISTLSIGDHDITAVYSGDANFLASTSPILVQAISRVPTVTQILVGATNPSTFGQTVQFPVHVQAAGAGPGNPTGTVDLFDGETWLGSSVIDASGNATIATNAVPVGFASVEAAYEGDANYLPSVSSSVVQFVNKSDTATSLLASINPSQFGQTVTFTASITPVSPGAGMPGGSVTFFDGASALGTSSVSNGSASLDVSSLPVGDHQIAALYNGDNSFLSSRSPVSIQTVTAADTTTSLVGAPSPSVFGQSVTFTATVSAVAPAVGTPDGSVDIFDGLTMIGSGTLVNCVATYSTSGLDLSDHTISAQYVPTIGGNFAESASSAITQTVNTAGSTVSISPTQSLPVSGQAVLYTITVAAAAPGSGTPTGTVNVFDGMIPLAIAAPLVNGQAIITAALDAGTHSVTAYYLGDSDFALGSGSINESVNKAVSDTALESSAAPSVYGQTVTLTANVSTVAPGDGIPTGSVTFFDGQTALGTVVLSGGIAALDVTGLSIGGHSITATYTGDGDFDPGSAAAITQVVSQAATSTIVVASQNPSVFGQSVTFTATVAASASASGTPTGTVTFFDGVTQLGTGTLSGGVATFTTDQLGSTDSPHSVTAAYSGDANFSNSSSASITQSVGQASTSTAISSSATTSVFGQSVTFTATVSAVAPGAGAPSGLIAFMDGTNQFGLVVLSNGVASYTTSSLTLGAHSITAVFPTLGGDYSASTSEVLTESVNQASSTTTVSAAPIPSVAGQSITFTINVAAAAPGSGTPTGTVSVFDGATPLAANVLLVNGSATVSAPLDAGAHAISASYSGSPAFGASSSALQQLVNKSGTVISFHASAISSVFGQPVSFSATVSPVTPGSGTPTGSVTFLDGATSLGNVELSGGTASVNLTGLSVGSHSIRAIYSGDNDFGSASTASLTHTVQQATTTTIQTSSATPSVWGQGVTFTATVIANAPGAGTPAGQVTFLDGSNTLGTASLNGLGIATFTTASASVGNHTITAQYAGGANFASSLSSPLPQIVNKATTSATVTSSPNPAVVGQLVTFSASVSAVAPGAGTPTGTVTFMDGPDPLGIVTLQNGTATLSASSLSVTSDNTITAIYAGDGSFLGNTSAPYLQDVNPAPTSITIFNPTGPSVAGQTVTITAVVTAVPPGAEAPIGSVSFLDESNGGALLGSVSTSNGTAVLQTSSLSVGDHTIRAVFNPPLGADFAQGVSSTITETVRKASSALSLAAIPSPLTSGALETFTATATSVTPAAGTPTGSVAFFNGSTVIGTANLVNGIATMTAPLSGLGATYTITASYSGDSNFAGSNSAAATVSILKADTQILVNAQRTRQGLDLMTTVQSVTPGGGVPTGTVAFLINRKPLRKERVHTLVHGGATRFFPSRAAIGRSFTVEYLGNASYNPSMSSVVHISRAFFQNMSRPLAKFHGRAHHAR
jgi:autotransporter-associated beta strand protein